MDDKKAFVALENLAADKIFEVTESFEALFILLVHAVALNRRRLRTLKRFQRILGNAKLSEEHVKKCRACRKEAKKFMKGFRLGI